MNQTDPFLSIRCRRALLVLALPAAAMAQPQQDWELTVGAAAQNMAYREFSDNGRLLNQEDGSIPGVALGLSRSHQRWRFAGDFSYHAGSVTYRGQTNTGVAITTRTRQNIVDLALRAEYWLATTGGTAYALYAGTGYHHGERDIQPTRTDAGAPVAGLFETYRWWSGFAGTKVVLHQSDKVRWLLDLRLTRTINPTVAVDFNRRYDDRRLDLGPRWGARVALPWQYAVAPNTGLSIVPYVQTGALGRSATMPLTSNGLPAGVVFEPRSENRNYGLIIGLSRRF